jgi:hypothetical protein
MTAAGQVFHRGLSIFEPMLLVSTKQGPQKVQKPRTVVGVVENQGRYSLKFCVRFSNTFRVREQETNSANLIRPILVPVIGNIPPQSSRIEC